MSKLSAAELDAWRDDFGLVVLATLTRPISVCMSETDTEKRVLSRTHTVVRSGRRGVTGDRIWLQIEIVGDDDDACEHRR